MHCATPMPSALARRPIGWVTPLAPHACHSTLCTHIRRVHACAMRARAPYAWSHLIDAVACSRSPVRSVTAKIGKKKCADKPAYTVYMHGDDDLIIWCDYYLNKHPKAYPSKAECYLTNSTVKVLAGKPPTKEGFRV